MDNIDWLLLRDQKEWLLNNNSSEALGLVHLVDYIQDNAIIAGLSEEAVFGDLT